MAINQDRWIELLDSAATTNQPIALPCSNFEIEFEALTYPGSRAALHLSSDGQSSGGLNVIIAGDLLSNTDPRTWPRTGSIEGYRHIYKKLIADETWFRVTIRSIGNRLQVSLNNQLVTDFIGSPQDLRTVSFEAQAFPAPLFRAIRYRRVPDASASTVTTPVSAPDPRIQRFTADFIPLADLHVHLKGGLTLDDTLAHSHRTGLQHGIAVNCGKGFPVQTDEAALEFCNGLRDQPVFAAMQAEGREWTQMFSPDTAAAFDYIFTDSMTWTDEHGRRMRLWIPEEVGEIANVEEFMETLVARTVNLLEHEPIDIYVNPTFLPAVLENHYNELWTERRMQRVVEAATHNQVAIELNDLYHLPSAAFVRLAKEAGCKFTLGTNNTGRDDLGICDYGLKMIAECDLKATDFFVPAITKPKAALTKALAHS